MYFIFLLLTSWLISFATVALIQHWGSSVLLDIPNRRSSHLQPTPRGGGLGFVVAFWLTGLVAQWGLKLDFAWLGLWLVLLPLAVVGFIDDLRGLSARLRYGVQLIVATIAVWYWGLPAQSFAAITSGDWWSWAIVFFTIIGFTAMINFYNFMDGLDGLVAGCSAIQLTFLAVVTHQPIWGLMVAATVGFIWWNWSPASIFMGDAGSTVLGASVATAILAQNQTSIWWASIVTLPLVLDAVYTLFRRLLRGENIFQAHRSHLYQRLQLAGWSHGQVATSYVLLNSAIAIWLYYLDKLGIWLSLTVLLLLVPIGEIYLMAMDAHSSHRAKA